jgi:hypothetical protein
MGRTSNQARNFFGRLRRVAVAAKAEFRRPADDSSVNDFPDTTNASAMFAWFRAQGDTTRPQYLWPVLLATRAAKGLGYDRISLIEFGVAGGNGLIALESAASRAQSLLDVEIDVYGFDTGSGMPDPVDHRDLPWVIKSGWFAMDEPALRARLTRAQLVLGPIAETIAPWLAAEHAPIGFMAFDLDYYSSTMQAFRILEGNTRSLLPRVPCYFDDIFGYGWSDFSGERAAIADFNQAHEHRKIGAIHGLRYELPPSEFRLPWPNQIYVAHTFDHPRYNDIEGEVAQVWFDALRLQDSSGTRAVPPNR